MSPPSNMSPPTLAPPITVKSLFELATMVCIKNIKALDSVGDYLPYESVRHILQRVESAQQLRRIELNSPQLQGHTSADWVRIIEKDFPLECRANAYKPPSPDRWYKVWEKYKREHDVALAESERQLQSRLAGLQEDKARNTSQIVKVESQYLPRPKRLRRAAGSGSASSTLTFGAGSRTKTNSGANVMKKVRREARQIINIKTNLSQPARTAPKSTPIIRPPSMKRAPAAMVDDHRRATLPLHRAATTAPGVEQFEARATVISDSENDDDSDDRNAPGRTSVNAVTKKPKAQPSATAHVKKAYTTAQVSLLKAKPAARPVIKRVPAPQVAASASNPQAKTNPSLKGSSGPAVVTAAATGGRSDSGKGKGKGTDARDPPPRPLPSKRTTPPSTSEPTSAEEVVAHLAAAPPAAAPRKRKAPVDIFMRPKKRVH